MKGIDWWPLYFPYKGHVMRKVFPYRDVIMYTEHIYMKSKKSGSKLYKSPFSWHFAHSSEPVSLTTRVEESFFRHRNFRVPVLKRIRKKLSLSPVQSMSELVSEWWSSTAFFGHWGPYRPCNHNLSIGIITFPYSSEILLGQWHPAGAMPHHAKPILCFWLEIWALHQVLLTSMQHGFLSRPPVKNGLDAVCTDVVRWLHTSELGFQSCG